MATFADKAIYKYNSYSYILIEASKMSFDSIALGLIGTRHSGSKHNKYDITCICLLTNYPIVIQIPDKTVETVVQTLQHHIYATFTGSLALIPDNGNELKTEIFQKVTSKLEFRHHSSSPYLPQSNGIVGKFHSPLKFCDKRHGQLD